MIVISSFESDGDGGFFVKFVDTAQDISGHLHATTLLLDELMQNFRSNRGAPTAKIENAIALFDSPTAADPAKIEAFQRAYEELVDDIVDLRVRGLKSNTPHGVHEAAKAGTPPDDKWLSTPHSDEYAAFRETNR